LIASEYSSGRKLEDSSAGKELDACKQKAEEIAQLQDNLLALWA
jgi:hypothetical protein